MKNFDLRLIYDNETKILKINEMKFDKVGSKEDASDMLSLYLSYNDISELDDSSLQIKELFFE